jgi:hypothetical protein
MVALPSGCEFELRLWSVWDLEWPRARGDRRSLPSRLDELDAVSDPRRLRVGLLLLLRGVFTTSSSQVGMTLVLLLAVVVGSGSANALKNKPSLAVTGVSIGPSSDGIWVH